MCNEQDVIEEAVALREPCRKQRGSDHPLPLSKGTAGKAVISRAGTWRSLLSPYPGKLTAEACAKKGFKLSENGAAHVINCVITGGSRSEKHIRKLGLKDPNLKETEHLQAMMISPLQWHEKWLCIDTREKLICSLKK
ncbi:hypothetical protein Y1Q_0004835 [Alligator mississippiensis]|uniref:Uncharacterized protein n=1 Tax=Alligator mississippiensis TaxID=8496 RepID=A0A151NQY6_ALLMI|nr:hypothetical protein Y1Q_0004835 [Alligator mississippiensis]